MIGLFIDEDLDYELIQKNAVGAVAKPNSSFAPPRNGHFNPIGRWKELSTFEASRVETLLAPVLTELGYPLPDGKGFDFTARRLREFYPPYFELKLALRKSSLSRFVVSKNVLCSGFLDEFDARWEAIRNLRQHSGNEDAA
jgi:hypothetical protein